MHVVFTSDNLSIIRLLEGLCSQKKKNNRYTYYRVCSVNYYGVKNNVQSSQQMKCIRIYQRGNSGSNKSLAVDPNPNKIIFRDSCRMLRSVIYTSWSWANVSKATYMTSWWIHNVGDWSAYAHVCVGCYG